MTTIGRRWLHSFSVRNDDVTVLDSPASFYATLLELVGRATRRLSAASLYVGGDEHSLRLLAAVESALARSPGLHFDLLVDGKRADRRDADTQRAQQQLGRLVQRFGGERVRLRRFYRTRGGRLLDRALPLRVREVTGVQHIKALVVDDSVLVTGANLSLQYYTDRQDRAVLFQRAPDLAAALCQLLAAVGDQQPPPAACRLVDAAACAADLLAPCTSSSESRLVVALQAAALSVDDDSRLLDALLARPLQSLHVASPYMNFTESRQRQLLDAGHERLTVLTGSTASNAFATATDASRHIPAAYALQAGDFYARSDAQRQRVQLFEYERHGWSYHAKGLWWQLPHCVGTVVGSSNLSYRSEQRDVELQFYLSTQPDSSLARQLDQERARLFQYARPFHPTAAPRWLRYVAPLVSRFL